MLQLSGAGKSNPTTLTSVCGVDRCRADGSEPRQLTAAPRAEGIRRQHRSHGAEECGGRYENVLRFVETSWREDDWRSRLLA
jgi:hypothetical protein